MNDVADNDLIEKLRAFQKENNITDISDFLMLLGITEIAQQKSFPLNIDEFIHEYGDEYDDVEIDE